MKYFFKSFYLIVVSNLISLSVYGSNCSLVLATEKGDFRTIIVHPLSSPPEEGLPSGKFKIQDGFYCDGEAELKGRISFKDQSGGVWVLLRTVEKMADNTTLATLNKNRNSKPYSHQLDFSFIGKPCDLLKQKRPFALIGLETKKGKSFSASLICKEN